MTRLLASLGFALLLAAPGCKSDEPAPADGPPPASQPGDPAPGAEAPAGMEVFAPVIGKSVADAEAWLKANPTGSPEDPNTPVVSVRPIKVDGEEQARTMDMRNDRLNVIVEGGVITGLDGIY